MTNKGITETKETKNTETKGLYNRIYSIKHNNRKVITGDKQTMTNNKKTVIKTEYKDTDSIYEMRQDNKYNTIIEVYKNNKIVLVTSISEIIEAVNEKRVDQKREVSK